MSTHHSDAESRLDHLHDVFRRAGVKMTHQRTVIFRTVSETDEHPDVETVYKAVREQVPAVSLDTVYRTLWLLKSLGLISTLGPPRERVRFDANTSRHHHFVCARCGRAEDFYNPKFDELPVPDEVKAMGSVLATHVELRGLCSSCLEEERDGNAEKQEGGTS